MATFTGTNADDVANEIIGGLGGFTGGSVFELKDTDGDTFSGLAGKDTIIAGSGNDLIEGGDGADYLDGGLGNDTYIINDGDVDPGEFISDSGGSLDTLNLLLNGGSVIFPRGTVSGIERVFIVGDGSHAFFNAGLLPANLNLVGVLFTTQILEILNASNFSAANWTFSAWEATDFISVSGTAGNDTITGSSQNDTLIGNNGNDTLAGGLGDDVLEGAPGNDTATYQAGAGVTVSLSIAGAQATGGAGMDQLITIENLIGSASGSDTLTGDGNANVLTGLGGNDRLSGLGGSDVLTGGLGRDTLFGGPGADRFDFNKISETKKGGQRDKLMDFSHSQGDRIDLRDIDAKTGGGNQKFKFIGDNDFSGAKGELRFDDNGSKVTVQGDTNGNGKADFEIFVAVGALAKGDFFL